jgi:hypothetical protein
METSAPGVMGCAYEAEFTTPAEENAGACAQAEMPITANRPKRVNGTRVKRQMHPPIARKVLINGREMSICTLEYAAKHFSGHAMISLVLREGNSLNIFDTAFPSLPRFSCGFPESAARPTPREIRSLSLALKMSTTNVPIAV